MGTAFPPASGPHAAVAAVIDGLRRLRRRCRRRTAAAGTNTARSRSRAACAMIVEHPDWRRSGHVRGVSARRRCSIAAVFAWTSGSVGSVTAGTAQVFAAASAAASDPLTISRRRTEQPPDVHDEDQHADEGDQAQRDDDRGHALFVVMEAEQTLSPHGSVPFAAEHAADARIPAARSAARTGCRRRRCPGATPGGIAGVKVDLDLGGARSGSDSPWAGSRWCAASGAPHVVPLLV